VDTPRTIQEPRVLEYASPRLQRQDRSAACIAAIVGALSLIKIAWAVYFGIRFSDRTIPALSAFKDPRWPASVMTLVALPLAHGAVFVGAVWSLVGGRLPRFARWAIWTLVAALLLESLCAVARLSPWDRILPDYVLQQLTRLAPATLPLFLMLLLSGKSAPAGRLSGARIWWLAMGLCAAAAVPMAWYWITDGRGQWIDSALALDRGIHGSPYTGTQGSLFLVTRCLGQLSLDAGAVAVLLLGIWSLLQTPRQPARVRACTTLMFFGLGMSIVWLPSSIVGHTGFPYQIGDGSRHSGLGTFLPLLSWDYWLDWEPSARLLERQLVPYFQFASSWMAACAFVIALRVAINRPEVLAWSAKFPLTSPPPSSPPSSPPSHASPKT
jgi:hypothetical protein